MNIMIRNTQEVPVYFNWALLHLTERTITTLVDTSDGANFDTLSSAQQENFFRNNGTERGLDFYSTAFGTVDMVMRSINSDDYHVLKRGTKLIQGVPSGVAPDQFNNEGRLNYLHMKKYFPINRQLRYASEDRRS